MRVFLQKVGDAYDVARGFERFKPTTKQWNEVLAVFSHRCCYCGRSLQLEFTTKDHLVPLNKEHLGLHCWGNVVPCCADCNRQKQHKDWRRFLQQVSGIENESRTKTIEAFIATYKYSPNLQLSEIAGNLYEDVGALAMTLIDLRFKQAQERINRLCHVDVKEVVKPNQEVVQSRSNKL